MRAFLIATSLVALCALGAGASTVTAAAGGPFPCNASTIFVAQGTSTGPTQLEALIYGNGGQGSFTNIGSPVTPPYNAIGFRDADHYIYGINADGHVVQIDQAGAATDRGVVPPLVGNFVNNGAFDTSGNYYVQRGTQQVLFRVDLATNTAVGIPLTTLPGAVDFTPVGAALWGQEANTNRLVRINQFTGQVDRYPTSFIPSNVVAGAAWTYGNGDLGLSDNLTGTIYQVRITNPNGPTPTFDLVSTRQGPASFNNDGTSCEGLPADLSLSKSGPATTYPGGTITWTVTVHNNGPGDSSGYVVKDTVPPSVTNVSSPTPGCSVSGQVVTCTGGTLASGADATFTIKGTVAGAAGSSIANSACVTGNEDDLAGDNNCGSSTSSVRAVLGLCRGTALRTGDLLVLSPGLLFGTANEQEFPCVTAAKHTLDVPLPGLHVTVLSGKTFNGATTKAASSSVATVDLLAGTHVIHIGAVESTASASLGGTCSNVIRQGHSNVASLTVDGKGIAVADQPITVPLPGLGAIYVNQTILTTANTVTQRGVYVDLPGTSLDVIVAESKAGISCAGSGPARTAPRALAVSRKGARRSARRMRAARL
jgi:uncharacterized repeat protein (TIGR01451 family)